MFRPPGSSLGIGLAGPWIALSVFTVPAAVQQPATGASAVGEAIGAMLITLVVGGGLILLAPAYTERTTDRVHEQPGRTFLYGLGITLLSLVLIFVLVLTIVGIILAIPLIIVLLILGELGYLAVGRVVDDAWAIALLVAVIVAGFVGGVPILGALVGLVVGSMGVGAAYLDYRGG